MSETTESDTTDPEMTDRRRETATNDGGEWVSGLIALLGVWLVAQVLVFDLAAAQLWNDVVVGALLAAAGGYNFVLRRRGRVGNLGIAIVAAVLGVWLVVAPFLGTEAVAFDGLAVWNDVVVGLLALVLGAYSAYVIRDRREAAPRATA